MKVLGNTVSKNVAKCVVNFWAKVESNTFNVKPLRLLLGEFLKKLGYFLIICSHWTPHDGVVEQVFKELLVSYKGFIILYLNLRYIIVNFFVVGG